MLSTIVFCHQDEEEDYLDSLSDVIEQINSRFFYFSSFLRSNDLSSMSID